MICQVLLNSIFVVPMQHYPAGANLSSLCKEWALKFGLQYHSHSIPGLIFLLDCIFLPTNTKSLASANLGLDSALVSQFMSFLAPFPSSHKCSFRLCYNSGSAQEPVSAYCHIKNVLGDVLFWLKSSWCTVNSLRQAIFLSFFFKDLHLRCTPCLFF